VQSELDGQIERCKQLLLADQSGSRVQTDIVDAETFSRVVTTKIPVTDLYLFAGRYEIWQELFSHLQDTSFLMANSLKAMTLRDTIDVLLIARKFEMKLLAEEYVSSLIARINVADFSAIFEAALGLSTIFEPKTSSKPNASAGNIRVVSVNDSDAIRRPHLRLCCACLSYLSTNLEQLFRLSNAQTSTVILQLLHQCLELVILP
jgi:hypothetical protein